MRRSVTIFAGLALVLVGCGKSATGPDLLADPAVSLVPDYAESMAARVDGAGIGAVELPPELALTTEQKAAIVALHEAFKAATAADVAALRALEAEARAALSAGKSRDEIKGILARGAPILGRLAAAFAKLSADIRKVYTPEQIAWIDAHRRVPCGPGGAPPLTDAQVAQIRALQQAFMEAVKDDVVLIRRTVAAATEAARNGASRERVSEILRQADAARERLRQAEIRLSNAIDAILTPEQKARRCAAPGRP